ncbi:MAG: hypothetical protein WAN28_16100, partial [Terracidiphilus sp.]
MQIRQRAGARRLTESRRTLLRRMAALSVGVPLGQAGLLPLLGPGSGLAQEAEQHMAPAPAPTPTALSAEDDQFLNDLEHANFLFFWEQGNPHTGLIKDRC